MSSFTDNLNWEIYDLKEKIDKYKSTSRKLKRQIKKLEIEKQKLDEIRELFSTPYVSSILIDNIKNILEV